MSEAVKQRGANNAPKYVFRALHVVSNVPSGEGQWYRDDLKDSGFEKVLAYEDSLDLNTFDGNTVRRLVKDLNLKNGQQNILTILDKLL
jgi:hypothetical protein